VSALALGAKVVRARVLVIASLGGRDAFALQAVVPHGAGITVIAQPVRERCMAAVAIVVADVVGADIAIIAGHLVFHAHSGSAKTARAGCHAADSSILGSGVKDAPQLRVA